MPSNKNAVIRYMYLDQMLSDRYNKYTCEDLLKKVNERLELAGYPTIGGDRGDYERYIKSGKRVIQLDLQALQESPFNMEIDSSEKLYGSPVYRYADQTQSLFSKPLSDDVSGKIEKCSRRMLISQAHFVIYLQRSSAIQNIFVILSSAIIIAIVFAL